MKKAGSQYDRLRSKEERKQIVNVVISFVIILLLIAKAVVIAFIMHGGING